MRAFPKPCATAAGLFHGAACLAALAGPPWAFAASLAVGTAAFLRYSSMAAFARGLTGGRFVHAALGMTGWLAAAGALALILVAVARFAPAALPWAAVTAASGPLAIAVGAAWAGFRGLSLDRSANDVAGPSDVAEGAAT